MSRHWSNAARRTLRPRPRLTASQWADRYRTIPAGTSPEPGQWRTSRVPYLREPLDVMSDPRVEVVVLKAASQVGKSEALLCVLGYYADQDPAPVLVVQPTVEMAEGFSKERIEPTFRESKGLRGKLEAGQAGRGSSRKSSETIRLKLFPGGYLALVGANAPAGLASRPIRVVLCDEIDRFPASAGVEGDPVKLAIQRTRNFANRKILLVSTPTVADHSPICDWYATTDQRRYWVPCPHCGAHQVLTWERVRWDRDDDGAHQPQTAAYECEHCGALLTDADKPGMLAVGEWRADNPEAPSNRRGYHVSALYSPWVTFAQLATDWCRIQQSKDKAGLREFVNLALGEEWVEDTGAIDVETMEPHRHHYGQQLPSGIRILTAGVDVQDDRLEAEVVGWGAGAESWGVQYLRLYGIPSDLSTAGLWGALDRLLGQTWQTQDGRTLQITTACVDSGHYTDEVYRYCGAREHRRVWAVKGASKPGAALVTRPTGKIRSKATGAACWLFLIGTDAAKDSLFGRLRVEHPGPGYAHWPREESAGYDGAYFEGLLSERLETVTRAGRRAQKWVQVRRRNEPLDCRVYAWAAVAIFDPTLGLLDDAAPPQTKPATIRVPARRMRSRGIR